MKVAGSSVEVALSSHCGEGDILTGTNHFDELSSSEYEYPSRNNIFTHKLKGEVALDAMKKSGNIDRVTTKMADSGVFVDVLEPRFHMHAFPDQVLTRYERDISDYKIVTIVRNPWDMIVSFFWWSFYASPAGYVGSKGQVYQDNGSLGFSISSHPETAPRESDSVEMLKRKMEIFCQLSGDFKGPDGVERNQNVLDWLIRTSKRFYQIRYDHILRYENLQDDYNRLCASLDISQETLPRLKTGQRKARYTYASYYNSWTRDYVDSKLSMWVEKFGYTFD